MGEMALGSEAREQESSEELLRTSGFADLGLAARVSDVAEGN